MPELGSLVEKIRSKNAGPFWVTIDIFCGDTETFSRVCSSLSTERVAGLFGTEEDEIKRFELPDLSVIKFSLPRPVVQGDLRDRDMHGAAWAVLLSELDMN